MSLSLIVVALGAVVAAAGTGVLVTRCAKAPRSYYTAWALALFGLAVALGSQAIGDIAGYDDLLFRAMELGAQMVAPLALCLSLVEVVGRSVQARFAMRLAVCAIAVIALVILGTDPLSLTVPFSATWPDPGVYYQIWPRAVLDLLASFTLVSVLATVGVMVVRPPDDDKDAARPVVVAAAAAALLAVPGLAMIARSAGGVHLPVGQSAFALACTGAAALTWLAGKRAARLDQAGPRVTAGARGSERDDDWPDERYRRGDEAAAGPYDTGEFGRFDPVDRGDRLDWVDRGDRFDQADRAGRRFEPDSGVSPWVGSYHDEADPDWDKPDAEPFDGSQGPVRYPGLAELAGEHDDRGWDDGYRESGRPYGRDPYDPGPGEVTPDQLFGQITIYTLIEDRTGEFDRLTERVVAQVQEQEPGTLAYIVHAVPTAPMQRILYEVYRDRDAYDDHLRRPYIARYDVERRPFVLATNLIELGLQQAKVSAFPSFSAISDILSESGIDLTGVTRSPRGTGSAPGGPGGRPPGPAPGGPGGPGGRPPGPAPQPWSDPRPVSDSSYQHQYKGWDEIRGDEERYQ